MTGKRYSFPEPKHQTWQLEFVAALTECVHEKWLERICRAENAIFHRIEEMEALPVSIDDVNERCAMSYALSALRDYRADWLMPATHTTAGIGRGL
jgi:hypothetical protein